MEGMSGHDYALRGEHEDMPKGFFVHFSTVLRHCSCYCYYGFVFESGMNTGGCGTPNQAKVHCWNPVTAGTQSSCTSGVPRATIGAGERVCQMLLKSSSPVFARPGPKS